MKSVVAIIAILGSMISTTLMADSHESVAPGAAAAGTHSGVRGMEHNNAAGVRGKSGHKMGVRGKSGHKMGVRGSLAPKAGVRGMERSTAAGAGDHSPAASEKAGAAGHAVSH